MKKSFCKQKYKSLLLTATFSMAIEYLMLLSDTLIVGNILGERAISGVNLVTPVFGTVVFIATVISIGTSMSYSYEIGSFDKERADRFFGQGLILAIVTGIILFLLTLFGKGLYFGFFAPSAEVLGYAVGYYDNFRFVVLLYPLYALLVDMVYTDGDVQICNLSYAVQIGVNIPVSILLCKRIGIAGASLGTLIGTLLSLCILCAHFFRRQNSLHFTWHIRFADVVRVIKFSVVDAGKYLSWAVLIFALGKLIIKVSGDRYLPVLTIVTSIIELTVVFDGIGQAITPLAGVYRGEQNGIGLRQVMRIGVKTALLEGVAFSILLLLFAGGAAALFGITDPVLLALSKTAVRIVSITLVCRALLFLFTSYYLILDRFGLAVLISFTGDLLLPLVLCVSFGALFGLNGVWVGFAAAPALALALSALLVRVRYGKAQFPLLLDPSQTRDVAAFDLALSVESVMRLRDDVEGWLRSHRVSEPTTFRVMLLVEEVCLLIAQRNPGKEVLSELTVTVSDESVRLVLRDDGVIFNLCDADAHIDSLRTYMVSGMMERLQNRAYLTTTSYNRNTFVLPR